jgi:hypothetical protein
MKRFHIHLRVDSIDENVKFYATLFAREPVILKPDYAKWILDEPQLNFAISNHEAERGINHIGVQFESAQEFEKAQDLLIAKLNNKTDNSAVSQQISQLKTQQTAQNEAKCCYAKSNKHWLLDPQNVAWEFFHSYDVMQEYGFSDTKESICQASTGAEHESKS